MYVKYLEGLSGREIVREVKGFCIEDEDCEEEDGGVTHGASICDAWMEEAAFFANCCAQDLAGLLLDSGEEARRRQCRMRDPAVTVDSVYQDLDLRALAWFHSREAAEVVLDELCEVLARGGQFFDLTLYGEDGRMTPDA